MDYHPSEVTALLSNLNGLNACGVGNRRPAGMAEVSQKWVRFQVGCSRRVCDMSPTVFLTFRIEFYERRKFFPTAKISTETHQQPWLLLLPTQPSKVCLQLHTLSCSVMTDWLTGSLASLRWLVPRRKFLVARTSHVAAGECLVKLIQHEENVTEIWWALFLPFFPPAGQQSFTHREK
jgi:hypothetical protein